MGDRIYWEAAAERYPELLVDYVKLEEEQMANIRIGGVGAGSVEITHLMTFKLPWIVDNKTTKITIGLGDAMPVTFIIGLPFMMATKMVTDFDNFKCYSPVLNHTFKMNMVVPHKKTIMSLDVGAPGKRLALTSTTKPSPVKRARIEDLTGEDTSQE